MLPWISTRERQRARASSKQAALCTFMERHVDRGLFNIVQANGADRRDLRIDMGHGTFMDTLSLTAQADKTLLIVIPGYTLHVFEPKLQAPGHEILEVSGAHSRSTRVFQCRLPGPFKIYGHSVGVIMANSFKSNPAERQFEVMVKCLNGKCHCIQASSGMCVKDLKELCHAVEGGYPIEDSRFITRVRLFQGRS